MTMEKYGIENVAEAQKAELEALKKRQLELEEANLIQKTAAVHKIEIELQQNHARQRELTEALDAKEPF